MRRWVAIVMLLGSILPAAASDAPTQGAPASPGGAADAASVATIEGRTWQLVELSGQDDAALTALPTAATLRFDAGTLRAFAGCNQLAGSYRLDGDRITIGPLAGTMMACARAVMTVETAFKQALSGSLRVALGGDRLTLTTTADPTTTLGFAAAPPARIEGSWEITGYNNGRQAVVSPVLGSAATLSFADGKVSGRTGCNSFRGTYSTNGDRLAISGLAATRKACPDPELMKQERELLAAIESAATWTIDRGLLDIHRADGERALIASPADADPTPGN